MKLRRDFVVKALAKEVPFRELCASAGISRKTGYKWLERFREQGFEGLVDQSTRPRRSPASSLSDTTVEVIRLRQQHPTWGPKKLQRLLEKRLPPDHAAPSVRTISRVLERVHLLRRRVRQRPFDRGWMVQAKRKGVVVTGPNDVWTVDFKGWWTMGDGRRCEPLTVRDAFSRYVLELRILPRSDTPAVRAVFEDLFQQHGLPKVIQSDNGAPFAASRSLAGLTKLSAWWVTLGIDLVRSRPGCPQDNGAHERMHSDIAVELQTHAEANVRSQQRACNDWRTEFNHVRPHEALGLRTPAEVYRRSERRWLRSTFGAFPAGVEVVQLGASGKFWLDGRHHVFVSTALPSMHIGLQRFDEGLIHVWLHHLLIGWLRTGPGVGRYLTVYPFDESTGTAPAATAAGATAPPPPGVSPSAVTPCVLEEQATASGGDTHRATGDTPPSAVEGAPRPNQPPRPDQPASAASYGAAEALQTSRNCATLEAPEEGNP